MKKVLFFSAIVMLCTIACSNSTPNEKQVSTSQKPEDTAEVSDSKPLSSETHILINQGTARYLVQEQLASLNFPIDAIGETEDIEGIIVINSDGSVNHEDSKIIVQLTELRSDEGRRDRYLRNNSLESNIYPEAVFNVKELNEFTWPNVDEKEKAFKMLGDMTLHGVTKNIEWDVQAYFDDNFVTGQAKTNFPFSKFNMEIPNLFFILSVEDEIRIELDFRAQLLHKS